jgi:hypothetical protein
LIFISFKSAFDNSVELQNWVKDVRTGIKDVSTKGNLLIDFRLHKGTKNCDFLLMADIKKSINWTHLSIQKFSDTYEGSASWTICKY